MDMPLRTVKPNIVQSIRAFRVQDLQESAQAFTSDERAMINRVLDLQNFTVRQITTPLAYAVVGKTVLREIIGADFLTPFAAAYLRTPH